MPRSSEPVEPGWSTFEKVLTALATMAIAAAAGAYIDVQVMKGNIAAIKEDVSEVKGSIKALESSIGEVKARTLSKNELLEALRNHDR